jgi:hypothetical protein
MGHPLRAQFEALTRAEEAAGLYEETATIGFKLNWEKLLASEGLAIRGHTLERLGVLEQAGASIEVEAGPVVERHRTALKKTIAKSNLCRNR